MLKYLILLSALIIIAGCSNGNTRIVGKTVDDIKSEITVKRTTQTDVLNLYGEPKDQGIYESKITWRYHAQEVNWWLIVPFAAGGVFNYELRLKFDDDRTVSDFNYYTNRR